MATRTTNYELYKPDATDDFSDFRAEFNENMEIIDENLGGGGGSGGHTIIDENGQTMTQRTGLEFTGNVQVTDDNVNDKTIVEVVGGGGSEDVELTIAEYIALPDTKLSDDKNYFIKDINNDNVLGYPPLIYSDNEREVGVWRDGKPLYQRVWDFGSDLVISNSAFYITNIDASTIETIVEGFGIYSTGATRYDLMVNTNGTNIRLQADRTNGSANVRFLVLQYTKTTDVAGSGTWNGQGGIAHHYSTNETVIGTWYDGKPIYEKTYELSTALLIAYNDWTNTTIDSSNIQTVIDVKGYHADGTCYALMADPTRSSHTLLGLQTPRNNNTANVKVFVIQYTKITD